MNAQSFAQLGLAEPLLKQLAHLGYETPTPIQAACIPLILQKKDVLGLAQTGTGKTAAFSLPMIQNLVEQDAPLIAGQVKVLILSPTRELTVQIYNNIAAYSKPYKKLSTSVIYGGVGYTNQFKALKRGMDILVATPGRLIDHIERGTVDLSHVQALILDEADHMLDMGFAPALKRIEKCLPRTRHTLLFSATMPKTILSLAQSMLHNPETVMITPPTATADKVEQWLYFVPTQAEKRDVLIDMLQNGETDAKTLIFSRTKHGANRLAKLLTQHDMPANAIHGDKGQGQRERSLREFKTGEKNILVATDIAARGIDVKGIDMVINYDLPMEAESYIHRIGRTARAGADGLAISLCCADEAKQYREVKKLLGAAIPMHPDSPALPAALSNTGGRNNGRRDVRTRDTRSRSNRGEGRSSESASNRRSGERNERRPRRDGDSPRAERSGRSTAPRRRSTQRSR